MDPQDPQDPQIDHPKAGKPKRSMAAIASIVAAATLLSKLFGLIRQQAIAAAFGGGPVINAYTYAYVVPSFLLILLGGINGPFHSAMVSALSRRDRRESAAIVETTTTIIGAVMLVVTVALVLGAGNIIDLLAPGLTMDPGTAAATELGSDTLAELAQTRDLAVFQLQLMAPIALFAGLIGIGFGALNATDRYWLPSISPLLSSVVTIAAIGGFLWLGGEQPAATAALVGAGLLALSTTAGAVLQWLAQLPAQLQEGLGRLRLRLDWHHPGVREVFALLLPATLSSGMLQINLYTDLFFASYIPKAPAALNYANLLVQTPLGLVSSAVLVPLLPVLSRRVGAGDWDGFRQLVRQGVIVAALTMLPLSATMLPLATPIVRVVYERGAFGATDSAIVAAVLGVSAVGMGVYLGRDVMVRVFYALGDAKTPFRISIATIAVNAGLDWLLVPRFGAPGIVLATVGVNAIAFVTLLAILNQRVSGFRWVTWIPPLAGLGFASVIAGGACWGTLQVMERSWGTMGLAIVIAQIVIAGLVGVGVFGAIALALRIPEVHWLRDRLLGRWRSR